MWRLLIRLCLLWAVVSEAVFHLPLGHDSIIHWDIDYVSRKKPAISLNQTVTQILLSLIVFVAGELIAEVHTKNLDLNRGWVGIGFSNYGNLSDNTGDFCIVWKSLLSHNNGGGVRLQLTDVHVLGEALTVYPDQQQDCLHFKYIVTNGTLKWTFRRKFVTCDPADYAIEVNF